MKKTKKIILSTLTLGSLTPLTLISSSTKDLKKLKGDEEVKNIYYNSQSSKVEKIKKLSNQITRC